MSDPRRIVLDANILIRAVFGTRVLGILKSCEDAAAFYAPDTCLAEAQRYIPDLAARRNFDPAAALLLLDRLADIVNIVDRSLYEYYEESARARISNRDEDDWPVLALAILLDAPIWTEDQDFFGTGVATWTTRTVEQYLRRT